MAAPATVWGVDVGRCALKAVRLRAREDGDAEMLGFDYIEHAKILSQPDADRDALISAALEKFLSRNDITNHSIVVSVPGQHTLARFSKLPPVEAKKIPDLVRYEADQQIPFDIDEVVWDYQTFQEEDAPDIEVGIFAMKRELVRDQLLHFELAGIEPTIVQAAPLALYNAILFDRRLQGEAVVLLDIGAENTDLIIASQNSLWTRAIPLGGNNFTEALVKSFRLSFSKAEKLKRTAATSKYARQIFQAMRPIFADLVQELQRSIGFYSSTHRDVELSRVIGMGNAFKMPGLQKYLQQNLQMDLERPKSFDKVSPPEASPADQFTEQILSMGVAYGLALQGLGLGNVTSSLLPPEAAKQAVWRQKRPFFAAAAACLLLAAGGIWMRQIGDTNALAAGEGNTSVRVAANDAPRIINVGPENAPAREQGRTILAAARELEKQAQALQGQGDQERENYDRIIDLQRQKAVWPKILHMVHDSLPAEPALENVDSAEAYRAAIKGAADQLARSKRREVFIERFSSLFYVDLDDIELFNELEEPEDTTIPAPDDNQRPGFLITLNCRTPNQGKARFVSRTFMANLRANGQQRDKGFYVSEVALADSRTLGASNKPSSGRGRGGAGAIAKMYDPLTDEPMNEDWEFELQIKVVLQDLPDTEDAETGDEPDA